MNNKDLYTFNYTAPLLYETENGFTLRFHDDFKYNQYIIWTPQQTKLTGFSNKREAMSAMKKLAKDPNWR